MNYIFTTTLLFVLAVTLFTLTILFKNRIIHLKRWLFWKLNVLHIQNLFVLNANVMKKFLQKSFYNWIWWIPVTLYIHLRSIVKSVVAWWNQFISSVILVLNIPTTAINYLHILIIYPSFIKAFLLCLYFFVLV